MVYECPTQLEKILLLIINPEYSSAHIDHSHEAIIKRHEFRRGVKLTDIPEWEQSTFIQEATDLHEGYRVSAIKYKAFTNAWKLMNNIPQEDPVEEHLKKHLKACIFCERVYIDQLQSLTKDTIQRHSSLFGESPEFYVFSTLDERLFDLYSTDDARELCE